MQSPPPPPPPASAPAPSCAPPPSLFRVFLETRSDAKMSRYVEAATAADVLDQLPAMAFEIGACFRSAVYCAVLRHVPAARARPPPAHPLKYTNVCGRVRHLRSDQFYNPGVLPMVVKLNNAFGRFEVLYSVHTNLLTGQNRKNTLFRGGRFSGSILSTIDHAFGKDAIDSINMNMLVAHVRLAHPINVACLFLDRELAAKPHWACRKICLTEDSQAHLKSIKLTQICPTWQKTLLREDLTDVRMKILINVCRSGSVNFFLTVADGITMFDGIEHEYSPLLNEIVRMVQACT